MFGMGGVTRLEALTLVQLLLASGASFNLNKSWYFGGLKKHCKCFPLVFSHFISFCCSVVQLCLTLSNPMDCSTPGFPVLHHLPEFAQIHVP